MPRNELQYHVDISRIVLVFICLRFAMIHEYWWGDKVMNINETTGSTEWHHVVRWVFVLFRTWEASLGFVRLRRHTDDARLHFTVRSSPAQTGQVNNSSLVHYDTVIISCHFSMALYSLYSGLLRVLESPWICVWRSLKVLEFWFSKTPWPNQLILKKVFHMASFWPQMCIKSFFSPDTTGRAYNAYICL